MKKNISTCLVAMILYHLPMGIVFAQHQTHYKNLNEEILLDKHIPVSKQLNSDPGQVSFYRNNISIRAVRNFIGSFENASDIKWYTTNDGVSVHFMMNGIRTKVSYYKNGRYKSMLRYYSEEKLSPDIRQLIRSTYYDYSIYCITEFTMNDRTIYEIKLEDSVSWKIVDVENYEIKKCRNYIKAPKHQQP